MENPINPADIEAELERIWDSLQGTNKMRACLFNLIIYTMKNERKDYLSSVVKRVIERFPSRIIFITVDEKSEKSYLTTSASVVSAEEGECSIVCDFIDVEVSKSYLERVPFIILPHLLPDLPVYLVFADDPCKNDPVAEKLESFATRTIYDSETTSSLPCFANAVLKHKKASQKEIADLNWARIEEWRSLLADTFHTKEKLECLKKASSLEITYNAMETASFCHTRIQALYLQGFLACQLGWSLKSSKKEGDTLIISYENPELTIKLIPTKLASIPSGRIISLEIQTSDQKHFLFKRARDNPHLICIHVSSPDHCLMPAYFIFDREEVGKSLVKEICHKGTSKHYLALLTMLSKFTEGDIC